MSRNEEIADQLELMADLLDAMDVEFKPRAYRRAAERLIELDRPVESIAAEGTDALEDLDDVGSAIAEKIVEYLETGSIAELEELKQELPVDMSALTRVEGLGPKRVGALYRALEITDLETLEAAAEAGEIQAVDGFGEKTEANILERIPFAKEAAKRHLLVYGMEVAESILTDLNEDPSVKRCSTAGSIRRWLPTVGDVDLLVATADPDSVITTIEASDTIDELLESGDRKARARSIDGVSVDFRFVHDADFGAALQYFTGSKDHNVQLRRRAIKRAMKINEYGVFTEDGTRIAGETEEEVYAAVDLPVMPPEIREGRGELEAAEAGELPTLVEPTDLRGDLHTHTDWSDGGASIDEMLKAAAAFGHEYLAITDHAPGAGVRSDITVPIDEIDAQRAAIEVAREAVDIEVLHGVEANIEADGSIDLPMELLESLDIVIASPHAALSQDSETATERLITAIEHPAVDLIGHPSGRKLGQRPGLDLDVEAIVEAAAREDVALEVNSHPVRLDMEGSAVRLAIDAGAPVVISTDAHRPTEYELIRFGVYTARRGWAETDDILNTRSWTELKAWLD